MKIAVAGTGSIGRRHIRNLQELHPECTFILLRENGREDELSNELTAPVARTLREALSYAPDALIIATPSALHSQLLLDAIASGLPMYVEKPVVTCRHDLEAVRSAMAECHYSATTLAGCNLRFLPSLQRLHKLVHSNAIGQVVRASFEAGQWLPNWRTGQDYRLSYSADPVRGGGVLLDLVHEIDAARWLLGDFSRVIGVTARTPVLDIASEAVAGALLSNGDKGPLTTIALDYVARYPVRRYQLVGVEGTLTWDLPKRLLTLDTASDQTILDCGNEAFDVAATYRSAMAEFLTSLAIGGVTSQPLCEGLGTSELAIRIKESAC